ARRDRDPLEHRARAAALLVDDDRLAGRAMRIADRVGATLRDPREQRLRGARPVDRAGLAEAESGDAAHELIVVRRSEVRGGGLRHSNEVCQRPPKRADTSLVWSRRPRTTLLRARIRRSSSSYRRWTS